MTETIFSRTRMLFGEDGMRRLAGAHVAVFGLGGVGGQAAETLVRSGIGEMTVCDNDTVSVTNRNRQLFATAETTDMIKTEAAAKRLLSVNPDLNLHIKTCFFDRDTAGDFDFSAYDYVLDCIDTVSSKLLLIELCRSANTPLLACLGTGNKTDPTRLRVDDIAKTSVCPLARVMRREMRVRGVKKLTVLYSKEEPIVPQQDAQDELPQGKRSVPGSVAFVPPAAGLMIAGYVIRQLAGV